MLHQTRRRAKTNIIKVVLIIFSQKQTKITHGYYEYTALRINWKKFQNSVLGFSKRQTIFRPQVIHMLVGDDMSQSPHINGLNPCLSLNQLKSTSGLFHLYYKLSFVKKAWITTWVWSIMPAWIISQLRGGLSGGGVTQDRGDSCVSSSASKTFCKRFNLLNKL